MVTQICLLSRYLLFHVQSSSREWPAFHLEIIVICYAYREYSERSGILDHLIEVPVFI